VADPGCLSRIPVPDFYPSRIPNPKTATKERGEKKNFCQIFFVATNFTKCKIILFLNCSRKKFGPKFTELWNFLSKKLSLRSQNMSLGSGSATLVPGGPKTH
jgi:hypothetical protein